MMHYEVNIDDNKLQEDIEIKIREKIITTIDTSINDWNVASFIKENVHKKLEQMIEDIVNEKKDNSKKELELLIDKSIETTIKSKVRKALKQ